MHVTISYKNKWTVNNDMRFCCFVLFVLVVMILNEWTYLKLKSNFEKALNILEFQCEITLESFPGTNKYYPGNL